MKKGFTVILLTVFLLYRITFPTSVVHAEEVEISAPSGILMEMSTGTVLFEKDADTARPPASSFYGRISSIPGTRRDADGRYAAKMHFCRKRKRCMCNYE